MYIECTSDIMRMFSEFAKTMYINIYIRLQSSQDCTNKYMYTQYNDYTLDIKVAHALR